MAAVELRTVDDVYLGGDIGVVVGHTRADLIGLAEAIQRVDADELASVVEHRPPPSALEVTASFVGRRNYNRFDIEDAVGGALAGRVGLPYTSRRDGRPPVGQALSWRVHLEADATLVGLRLSGRPLHRRGYKVSTIPGTLHPPVAAALVWIADPVSGSRLLDPTCGAGTIAIEAGLLRDRLRVFATDIDGTVLATATYNALAAGSRAQFVRADAAQVPLRDSTIATVVTNPPWGRQVPAAGGLAGTLQPLWAEAERTLEPGGKLIVLAEPGTAVLRRGLRVMEQRDLSLRGAPSRITTLQRL